MIIFRNEKSYYNKQLLQQYNFTIVLSCYCFCYLISCIRLLDRALVTRGNWWFKYWPFTTVAKVLTFCDEITFRLRNHVTYSHTALSIVPSYMLFEHFILKVNVGTGVFLTVWEIVQGYLLERHLFCTQDKSHKTLQKPEGTGRWEVKRNFRVVFTQRFKNIIDCLIF